MVKVKLIQGHILDAIKQIPDNSIDCIITSPPYWSMRKYPDEANIVWDGDKNCEHEFGLSEHSIPEQSDKATVHIRYLQSQTNGAEREWKEGFCSKCDAWYGQLGLEPTLELYIKHLLQVTKELKRVLKKTGIMFWNHGDSYIGSIQGYGIKDPNYQATGFQDPRNHEQYISHYQRPPLADYKKLPPKCMALQNYRLILKLIDEQGWILRNIIVWYKPNHMPESVKDRFCRAYEPIFMLVKSRRYWSNLDAVRETLKTFTEQRKHGMERITRFGKFLNPVAIGYDSKFKNNPNALAGSPYSFNIRVREAKKGHFGKLGVKASEEEMEKYDNQGRLLKWVSPKSEVVEFMREKGSGGQYDYGGINSPNSTYRQKLKLLKHDIAVGRIGNFSYSDPLHTKPYSTSKFLQTDVKTASPAQRTLKVLSSGKLTTKVRKAIENLAHYLKGKKEKSNYTIDKLVELTGIKKTTLEHYFRTNEWFTIPDKQTWELLKPLLDLGNYEDFVTEEIRSALPQPHPLGKNPGDVWIINTQPFKETHFAVFPEELVRRCIRFGCPENGIVLDPFAGSGTTIKVAIEERRNVIGIEIVPEYIEMAIKRCNLRNNPLIDFEMVRV